MLDARHAGNNRSKKHELKIEALWMEFEFLRNFKHENVVKLEGVQLTANGDIDLSLATPHGFSMKNHLTNFNKFNEDLISYTHAQLVSSYHLIYSYIVTLVFTVD